MMWKLVISRRFIQIVCDCFLNSTTAPIHAHFLFGLSIYPVFG